MPLLPRNQAKMNGNGTTRSGQTHIDRAADADAQTVALDACRRRLQALLRKYEELSGVRSLLTERVSRLELALAKAIQTSQHDDLTGLPNRSLLLDRFNQSSTLANRNNQNVALLFFDLDNFKSVNDSLGHEAGDRLLQQVARRLTLAIRESDTACRYGGDEFVVLLTEIDHYDAAANVLQKIRAELALPYVIDSYTFLLGASDGMSIYPRDARSFTELLRLSDRSMFTKKPDSQRESVGAANLHLWLHGA